jgi:hypothetical protein
LAGEFVVALLRTRVPVRIIVGISLLLLGFGMLSCRIERLAAREVAPAAASRWVRTAQGWERRDRWVTTPPSEPAVHPLVVAAGQGLASVTALVALRRDARRC